MYNIEWWLPLEILPNLLKSEKCTRFLIKKKCISFDYYITYRMLILTIHTLLTIFLCFKTAVRACRQRFIFHKLKSVIAS
jgi:hypothetical protein